MSQELKRLLIERKPGDSVVVAVGAVKFHITMFRRKGNSYFVFDAPESVQITRTELSRIVTDNTQKK